MENALRDARYALRRLRYSPGFTAAAIAVLALGIGSNVLIFSVVNALFLRPLSYSDPGRLVWIAQFYPQFNRTMAFAPDYAAWKRRSTVFAQLEAMGFSFGRNLSGTGRPAERVQAAHVTPGFFSMVGVAPRIGAGFDPNAPASQSAVIVSDALWRGYLGADPDIVGKPLTLDGKSIPVAGVLPAGFVYPDGADIGVWLPDAVPPARMTPSRSPEPVRVIGRLKPRVTMEQARAELAAIARGMDKQYPTPWSRYHAAASVRAVSLQAQLTTDSRTPAMVLMGAVAFLLMIACANVANLFLARAVGRRKEIAMRLAIGARPGDIVRMLVTESLVLGALGGALGIALLYWGRSAVMFLMPKALATGIPIDWRVEAFAAGCSLFAGLLFGLLPAVTASRAAVNTGLKETAIPSATRLPVLLAAAQIALSVVLLTGAGLLIRTFWVVASTNPGFDARNILTATAMLQPVDAIGPQRQVEYFERVLDGIGKLPGVVAAAATSAPPMTQFSEIESGLRADEGPETSGVVSITSVSANYFHTIGIRLIAGRFFDQRDVRGRAPAAIVNEKLARILFHGRDPVGHKINSSLVVVGVVADTRHRALDDTVWPELFLPFEQSPGPWITFVVRGAGDSSVLASPIRQIAQSVDPSQPLFDVDLLEHRVSNSLGDRRERATILGALAVLALLIAAVGIYGLMSYGVSQRTHEIGLRMALGATRADVLRMMVVNGMRIAAAGLAVGLVVALEVTRVLRSFLYGVEPSDAVTFSLAFAILGMAALLASYLPARRAAAVDPMAALREQ